jgi:hypothetical protein
MHNNCRSAVEFYRSSAVQCGQVNCGTVSPRSSSNLTLWTARTMKRPTWRRKFLNSRKLLEHWLTADYSAKRRILEIVLLNCRLDDVNLVATIRKPFDVIAEGLLVSSSRGDRRSFEPLIAAIVDAALSPSAETVVANRVMRSVGYQLRPRPVGPTS